jgi:hypothetical protein
MFGAALTAARRPGGLHKANIFWRNMNKENEYEILNDVYQTDKFEIERTERPDFILKNSGVKSLHKFGVEITELYTNESHARVKNIKGYINEIFDYGKYRKQIDEVFLPRRKVKLISPENVEYEVMGIIENNPKYQEYEKLADEITKKDIKYSKYNKECVYTNLVIRDYEQVYLKLKNEFVLLDRLESAIQKSKFRELFLISETEESKVYIPLKLLCIYKELSTIKALMKTEKDLLELYGKETLLNTLYGVFSTKNYNEVKIIKYEDKLAISISRYIIKIDKIINIKIRKEGDSENDNFEIEINKSLIDEIIKRQRDDFIIEGKLFFDSITEKIEQ